MITSEQVRAARALLRLGQAELARRAGLSLATVRRLEARGTGGTVADATVDRVRRVLEEAGAEFLEGGVRHRPRSVRDAEELYRAMRAIAERSARAAATSSPMSEADLYDDLGLPA